MESVDHLVHEQGYIAAIREQPEVDDDGMSFFQRVVGDSVGVKPEKESFENKRIFGFQIDDAAARFCPWAFERSSEVAGVER